MPLNAKVDLQDFPTKMDPLKLSVAFTSLALKRLSIVIYGMKTPTSKHLPLKKICIVEKKRNGKYCYRDVTKRLFRRN